MRYSKTREAVFVKRPNRFVAVVEIDGVEETVHVNNTGRCEELLVPGCRVILSESDNEKRKTKYDLVAVYKDKIGIVNIDSLAPNVVIKEWLERGNEYFPSIDYLKPECNYDKSRFDFYMETED
ncbi:MAG: DNA/RNA nuclease SfsA, partial [Lachnospiraceae bacterium]|nr:DNA/RNA nuclease SfsA [Lachnospiraceae bacterium]